MGRLGIQSCQRFAMRHSGCKRGKWWYTCATNLEVPYPGLALWEKREKREKGGTGREEDLAEGSQKRRI